jgi:hypothetical protein
MKAHDVFPSTWLAASDLGTARPTVTIERVDWATFQDGTRKRAVYFAGKDKALTVNMTNWSMIAEVTGCDDDEEWPGHRIRLYATRVDFKGKMVDAIRVDKPAAAAAAPTNGKRKAAPVPPPEPDFDAPEPGIEADDMDPIPF